MKRLHVRFHAQDLQASTALIHHPPWLAGNVVRFAGVEAATVEAFSP